MKKTLVALAVLGSFAGAASAASSVTLYGRMDIGYESNSKDGLGVVQGTTDQSTYPATSDNDGMSRIGIKGQEDLGNGLAATFQLEGSLSGDTGSWGGSFNRESTVGLKGNFGHVRFGRSTSALENTLGDYDQGRRVASYSTYQSGARHSNGMFYSYSTGGFEAGFDVTTKGGDAVVAKTEGASGEKVGYGLYAKYAGNNFSVAAAYQRDGSALTKEWGLGGSYTFKPVTVGATYAQQKEDKMVGKARTIHAFVSADITANDNVYLQYNNLKDTIGMSTGSYKRTQYGLGYVHSMSKRTSVYAEVARDKQTISTGTSSASGTQTKYAVAMRHWF